MAAKYSLKRYQPINLRVWHWLNAFFVTSLLGTVVLRKTFLSRKMNVRFIEEAAAALDAELPQNVAKNAAKAMVNNLWDWHIYLGFALSALLVYRIVIIFLEKRFPLKPSLEAVKFARTAQGEEKVATRQFAGVQFMYFITYGMLLFMVLSGLFLSFADSWGISEEFSEEVCEFHEAAMWFFAVFVPVHVAGVVRAELTRYKGIVSDMIHGGNP